MELNNPSTDSNSNHYFGVSAFIKTLQSKAIKMGIAVVVQSQIPHSSTVADTQGSLNILKNIKQ